MTAMRELLGDVASEARVYDVTGRAVQVLRRRRRLRRLGPLAVSLVVAAGLGAVALKVTGGDTTPTVHIGSLPQVLRPAESPPLLPADRPVGRAALVYLVAHDEPEPQPVVLTADGSHYAIPSRFVLGLSPDGRWLLWVEGFDKLVLRDLTSTTREEIATTDGGAHAVAWSPDGQLLVLQINNQPVKDSPFAYPTTYRIDLETLQRRTVPLDPKRTDRVCAVRNSGDVLLCPLSQATYRGLRLASGTTGRVLRDIDVTPALRPGEAFMDLVWASLTLRSDDRTVMLRVNESPPSGVELPSNPAYWRRNSLVAYNLDTGTVTDRYPIPDQIPGKEVNESGNILPAWPDGRYLRAAPIDGVLLVHIVPRRDRPVLGHVTAIEAVAPTTGALSRATQVSGPIADIYLPGAGT